MIDLSIIVPVYNEERTAPKVIKTLKDVFSDMDVQIIIVDDGSTDGTWSVLKQFERDALLIRHETNKGKGSAIRTALQYAEGDYTVIQDADLEYNPEEIKTLLNYAREHSLDTVYGSRFHKRKVRGNFIFYLGNRFLTFITNLLFGGSITDMETCYKLVRTSLLKELSLKSKRFEVEPEITAKLMRRGVEIKEVPISYSPRNIGEKKIKMRDGFTALKTLILIWFKGDI